MGLHQGFNLVANQQYIQADNNLNAIAMADYAVRAEFFKHVVALCLRHINQRDTQPGGAVIEGLYICSTAKRLQESQCLGVFG